jgi:hypothetical protein
MKARQFYLVCCLLGLVLSYSQFVPWLLEHGLNITVFFRELFANRISAFFAMDVIVSAIVLIWFIQSEGKRLRVRLLGYRRLEHWSSVYRLDSRFFFF